MGEKMNKISGILLLAGAFLLNGTVSAQYRCGKVYQDTPCEGQGKSGGAITSSSVHEVRPSAAASGKDEYCTRRGLAAQKIKWGRESGLTAETQLSATSDPEEKRLISDVYRRSGNSIEVRNAVEADCLAEKERAAQAAALIAAAAKLQGNPPAQPQPLSASAASSGTASQKQDSSSNAEQVAMQNRCRNLNAERDRIVGQQRAGGGAAHMESLNRQRQQMDKNIRDAGC